jgi:PAS domain S-box-containing protein
LPADPGLLGPDVLRRMRMVVGTASVALPFYLLAAYQIWAHGHPTQALWALVGAAVTVLSVAMLRAVESALVPGLLVIGCLLAQCIGQAAMDAGLGDPVLLWALFVPVLASLLLGWKWTWPAAGVAALSINGLAILEWSGYAFPAFSTPSELRWYAWILLLGGIVFAAFISYVYERQTAREEAHRRERLDTLDYELRRSELRARQIYENAPVGMYRTTPEGLFEDANVAFYAMLGYDSFEQLRHRPNATRRHYADPARQEEFRRAVEREGRIDDFVSEWLTRDGESIFVREQAQVVRGPDGRARFYEGVAQDITAEHEAERALRENEERFRHLVQYTSDLIAVVDAQGVVRYVSPSVTGLLGRAPEEVQGSSFLGLLHPADGRRTRVLLHRAASRPGTFPRLEFRLRHADGHYVIVEAIGTNRLHDSAVGGLVANVRDVTEQKRAELALRRGKEHAEEASRLKDALLTNISHELRTPLTSVLGFTQLLSEEIEDPQHREFLGYIRESGQRLMNTLTAVLDLAWIEGDKTELAPEPIPLAAFAQDVLNRYRPIAERKGLAMRLHADPGAEAVLDPTCLDRILSSLVDNATKFTDTGAVVLEVVPSDEDVTFHLTDTGRGIDPHFLPRLFDEFAQESTGAARLSEGTGLGLTIAQRLVDLMHGEIRVDSAPGEGSRFSVRLPRVSHADDSSTLRPRVLVVDDNEDTRTLVLRMLVHVAEAVAVGSAHEALEAARETAYDAVLLDINLGTPTSGEHVMQRLRQLDAYAATPIIAFTAYGLPGDRDRFLDIGFDGYLSKPFAREQLTTALRHVLPDFSLNGSLSPTSTVA